MNDTEEQAVIDSDLAVALEELIRTAHKQKGRQVSLEEIRAFLDGELTESQEKQLKTQMALDPRVARTILEFRDFRSDIRADPTTIDASVPDWQTMRRRLREPSAEGETVSGPTARWWSDPRVWRLAAAVFLILASVSVLQNLQLKQRNQILEAEISQQRSADHQPRLNLFQIDVLPIDQQLDRDEQPGPRVLPVTGVQRFLLALNVADPGDYTDYGIEIADSDQEDEVVWGTTGLVLSPLGTFNIELDRGFLAAGTYRIRLFGLRGTNRDLLEEYRFILPQGE